MKSNQTELSPHVQTSLLQNAGPSQALDLPARPQTHLKHTEKLHTHTQASIQMVRVWSLDVCGKQFQHSL